MSLNFNFSHLKPKGVKAMKISQCRTMPFDMNNIQSRAWCSALSVCSVFYFTSFFSLPNWKFQYSTICHLILFHLFLCKFPVKQVRFNRFICTLFCPVLCTFSMLSVFCLLPLFCPKYIPIETLQILSLLYRHIL